MQMLLVRCLSAAGTLDGCVLRAKNEAADVIRLDQPGLRGPGEGGRL